MEVDTALHTMAAHLHRYKAEVGMIEENIQRLSTELAMLHSVTSRPTSKNTTVDSDNEHSFDTIIIRVQGLVRFVAELDMKTQTVIALVSSSEPLSTLQN
jgi:archaellum component FlaC